jgi:hypothetical protein
MEAGMMLRDKDGRYVEAPIHAWFGLSYSSYFVLPRLAMQEMPIDWQERFIALMAEAEALGLETPNYHVLRNSREHTLVAKYDPDDETSRDYEFTAVAEDEWANYRRGSAAALCPAFKVPE